MDIDPLTYIVSTLIVAVVTPIVAVYAYYRLKPLIPTLPEQDSPRETRLALQIRQIEGVFENDRDGKDSELLSNTERLMMIQAIVDPHGSQPSFHK